MLKTHVLDYEINGSVMSWPVSVSISRNSRSGSWTLYFDYEDPEARQHVTAKAEGSADIPGVLDEHFCDIDEFCGALDDSGDEELERLSRQIRG